MGKTNILFITSDQQHWNTIGAFNREILTPALDRLVKEGTTFSRAYCVNPTCTPTRASIITGKYPSQHGAWALGTKLPESENTVGDAFIRGGYKTALIGKAHFQQIVSTPEYPSLEGYPNLHDFEFWKNFNDKFYGFEHVELARQHTNEAHAGQHYALWLEEKGCKNWREYFLPPTGSMDRSIKHKWDMTPEELKTKPLKYKWDLPEEYHPDAWIAERTNSMLDQYKERNENFFLWASFLDPHPKYLAPKPWDTMYDPDKLTIPKTVEGEHENSPPLTKLTQLESPDFSAYKESRMFMHGLHSHLHTDDETKNNMSMYYGMISLMDKYIGKILDKLDELELTQDTLVVFTSDHGHFFGQHGLEAKGPFHYEDMIKVPFVVRYPGRVPDGMVSESLQSLVDLAPTFLSLAGLPVPREMTGMDQSAVWLGEKPSLRTHIICENHAEPTAIYLKTYVDERYKITVYDHQECGEIYDLKEDPGEFNNLWDNPAYEELKISLLLKYISAEMGKEPMWMPRVAGA